MNLSDVGVEVGVIEEHFGTVRALDVLHFLVNALDLFVKVVRARKPLPKDRAHVLGVNRVLSCGFF